MTEAIAIQKPQGSLFDSFQSSNEETFERILIRLLDPENVEMKTQIDNPVGLTRFITLARWLKAERCFKSAKTILEFVAKYLIYQVSKDRQSRTEIIHALTEGLKREKSLAEKLTERPT